MKGTPKVPETALTKKECLPIIKSFPSIGRGSVSSPVIPFHPSQPISKRTDDQPLQATASTVDETHRKASLFITPKFLMKETVMSDRQLLHSHLIVKYETSVVTTKSHTL
jgi:hypothetical protein